MLSVLQMPINKITNKAAPNFEKIMNILLIVFVVINQHTQHTCCTNSGVTLIPTTHFINPHKDRAQIWYIVTLMFFLSRCTQAYILVVLSGTDGQGKNICKSVCQEQNLEDAAM